MDLGGSLEVHGPTGSPLPRPTSRQASREERTCLCQLGAEIVTPPRSEVARR
jgi:hypothetical protein